MQTIRLGPEDFDRMVALWQRAGLHFRPQGRDAREAFGRQFATGVLHLLGMEEDGALVGVVMVTHDSRKGWLNRLAIDPAYQRQGLGSQLIAAAEMLLRAEGIQVIGVLIEGWNEPSMAVFVQAGYSRAPAVHYYSKRPSPDA